MGEKTLKNTHKILWGLLMFCCIQGNKAQTIEGAIGLGMTNYQGDLASFNFNNDFALKLGLAVNGSIRYYFNEKVNVRVDLMHTSISGDDAISPSSVQNARNLSFRSPITQLTLRADWNILGFLPGDPDENFSPFLSVGVGIFRFNPQAFYEGSWVELQPLGTEGQGIIEFSDQDVYNLIQFNIPIGAGIKFLLGDYFTITVEGLAFLTFTDYLDDVSTKYVSYPELLEARGALSAALANRRGELTGGAPVVLPTGAQRGNPGSNDFYTSGLVSIGMNIGAISEMKNSRYRNKCPKF